MKHRHYLLGLACIATLQPNSILRADVPPPTTADPVAQSSGTIAATDRTKQFSETVDASDQVFWFTYVSDGKSAVRFDTLGSNFSTAGGGSVLSTTNQSQIAVYASAGKEVGLGKYDQDLAGNSIAQYPYYTSTDVYPSNSPSGLLWYNSQGLTQLYLTPHAPTNPHWAVSPTDPTPYVEASASPTPTHPLGNPGNSQIYDPPNYYVPLNEYQVWNTALSPIVLNNQGQPVDSSGNVVPASAAQPQPGWRYYDRARVGPGSPWNRYDILPAGTYYIAVATSAPILSGDTSEQEVAEAPINYYFDSDTNSIVGPVPFLNGPLGNFQYFVDPSQSSFSGTIKLNVTKGTALEWNNATGNGNGTVWDVGANKNFNDSTAPVAYTSGDYVTFDDNNAGHYNVTLNSAVTPFAVDVINSSGDYSISGTGAINGAGNLTKSGTGMLTLATANGYTGETMVNQGTLNVTGSITGSAITVQPGATLILKPTSIVATIPEYAKNATTPLFVAPNLNARGTVSVTAPAAGSGINTMPINVLTLGTGASVSFATAASHLDRTLMTTLQLNLGSGAKLDLGGNDLIVFNGDMPTIVSEIKQGYNGGGWNGTAGITSSAANNSASPKGALGYGSIAGTFDGQTVAATDVVVKYTFVGDANLDGSVNFSDLLIVAQHYNGIGTSWQTGDYNYDGTTNFSDLLGLAQNYNKSLSLTASQLSTLDSLGGPSFASAWAQAEAQVQIPEPATVGLVCAGALALSLRRRKAT